jgi:beta-1,4-mannosyltransferase
MIASGHSYSASFEIAAMRSGPTANRPDAQIQAQHELSVLAWPAPSRLQSNPYTSLVYREFARDGIRVEPYSTWSPRTPRADIFHVHWPEAILWGRIAQRIPRMATLAAHRALHTMDVVRRRGGIVAWTVHNVSPHAFSEPHHERIWNLFFPQFRRRVDALIGLTSRSLDLVCDTYPELRACRRTIVPHPHYRLSYPAPPPPADARAAIGLPRDCFVVAMIGSIRRSKGVPQAIAAFRKARGERELLLIAGHCADRELAAEIRSAIGDDASVIFENRHLSDAALVRCFAAVDAVLINQASTLNSGTLLLALSMDRPAIAPARGSVVELAEAIGPKWISSFSNELAPEELRRCLDAVKRHDRGRRAPLEPYDPATVSRATAAALRDALADRQVAAKPRSSISDLDPGGASRSGWERTRP